MFKPVNKRIMELNKMDRYHALWGNSILEKNDDDSDFVVKSEEKIKLNQNETQKGIQLDFFSHSTPLFKNSIRKNSKNIFKGENHLIKGKSLLEKKTLKKDESLSSNDFQKI